MNGLRGASWFARFARFVRFARHALLGQVLTHP